jgi:cytochrome d ubiquinol oxidase subunit I
MLRGRRDRIHRLGLLIPLTVACIADADPVRGRRHGRAGDREGPAGQVRGDGVRAADRQRRHEYIYGRCTSSGVKGGHRHPGFDSFLVGWSTSTKVTGLDSVPASDRPPANTMLHWAFDTMVGICTMLIGSAPGSGSPGGGGATSRRRSGSCARVASPALRRSSRSSAAGSTPRSGRQPVDRLQRHAHLRRGHAGERHLGHVLLFLALYIALGTTLIITLRAMSQRWRNEDGGDEECRTARTPSHPRRRSPERRNDGRELQSP